jgi:hypothetical protein
LALSGVVSMLKPREGMAMRHAVGSLRLSILVDVVGVMAMSAAASCVDFPSWPIQLPAKKCRPSVWRRRNSISFSPESRCRENQSHPLWSEASGWLLHSRSIQA